MNKTAFVEKRIQKRFAVQEGTYAALKNHVINIGIIKDISRGGFAAHFISDGSLLHNSVMIEGLFKGSSFCLKGVPVKIISDLEIEDRPLFSSIVMRRCGVEFEDMTPSRMSQLDRFIEEHAM